MLDCIRVMLPASLYVKEYRDGKYNEKPKYGSSDYNTGIRTTCFCFSCLGVLECWSRAIAAKQLGRPTVTLNANKNGSNIIIASDKTVWVVYDTHSEKLATWINQDEIVNNSRKLFELIYDELPPNAKRRLQQLGYTLTEQFRIILNNDESGIVFL